MKYNFYKIQDKQFPKMGSWWVLVIDNPNTLVNYQNGKSKKLVEAYFKGKEKLKNKNHLNDEEHCMLMTIAHRPNRKTVVDDINIISDEMVHPLTKFYLDDRIPLVNQAGGYRFLDNSVKILDKVEKDEMVWPEDNRLGIKISRWPNGKHWYAKVGQYDVKDEEGNLKWNTERQARKEAEKFKEKIERKNNA